MKGGKCMEGILFPRGVDSARVIQVIVTKAARGSGSKDQPTRTVTEYWSTDGKKLAENDPYLRDMDSASSNASSESM